MDMMDREARLEREIRLLRERLSTEKRVSSEQQRRLERYKEQAVAVRARARSNVPLARSLSRARKNIYIYV